MSFRPTRTAAAALAIVLLTASVQASETAESLWKQGYQIVYDAGSGQVDECSPDKPTKVGPYVFFCSGYNYNYKYHYGSVFIAVKQRTYQGKPMSLYCWCLEGKNECLDGRVQRAP